MRPKDVTVGSHYWYKGKRHRVVRSISHSSFNPHTFKADIGLVKVEPAIHFTKGDKNHLGATWTVCLPKPKQEYLGMAIISGWGSERENGTRTNVLKEAKVKLLSSKSCKKYKYFQASSQICAGYNHGRKDACQVSDSFDSC